MDRQKIYKRVLNKTSTDYKRDKFLIVQQFKLIARCMQTYPGIYGGTSKHCHANPLPQVLEQEVVLRNPI